LQLTSPAKFCISIIAPAFLLLSAISGKQVHYLLPLLPAVLLLAGNGFYTNKSTTSLSHWLLPTAMLFLSLALLIVPALHLEGGDSEMLRFMPVWLGIGPLIAAFFCTDLRFIRNNS
jgi:hypothetical protein